VQARKLVNAWSSGEPTALQADADGPYWTRRSGRRELVLERHSAGRVRAVDRAASRVGHPWWQFLPQLVRGKAPAELFYRNGNQLVARGDSRLSGVLGQAAWEYFGAARHAGTLFVPAFGIRRDGVSYVAMVPRGKAAVVAQWREPRAGTWAPVALMSPSGHAIVVYRAFLLSPKRGHGIIVESMLVDRFLAQKRWTPQRWQYGRDERGFYYGDPTATLDPNSRVHWAATIWNDRDQPTGRIVVDGVELNVRGPATYWLPELTWVQGRGLVLSMVGASGRVEVGRVQGRQFQRLASLPGEEAKLASHGRNFYVSTSAGLWTFTP
jgi:hypothetical protein